MQSHMHAIRNRRRALFAQAACAICTNGRQWTAGNASLVRYLYYIAVRKKIEIPSGCDANAGGYVITETFGTDSTKEFEVSHTHDRTPCMMQTICSPNEDFGEHIVCKHDYWSGLPKSSFGSGPGHATRCNSSSSKSSGKRNG